MKNKVLWIAMALVLSLSVIFVSVFGIVYSSRKKNAFAIYGSATIGEAVYRYITYEMQTNIVNLYTQNVGVPFDSLSELSEYEDESGKTYEEIYRDLIDARIRSLAVCAHLFDSYDYTVDDDAIESALNTFLTYKTEDGKEKTLNAALADYGLSYDDLKTVATLLYKEQNIEKELYGENGEKLKNNQDTVSLLSSFVTAKYHGVKLLYIRTEDRFLVEEDGTVDTSSDPVALTTSEIVDRQADIQTLDAAITGGTVTADALNTLIAKYKNDGNVADAYYYHPQADFTLEQYEGLPEVVTAALDVLPGETRKVSYDGGYCYVYGLSVPEDAYLTATNSACFSDFYALCADYLFTNAVEGLAPDVTFTEKCRDFDVFSLPYDSDNPNYYVLSLS